MFKPGVVVSVALLLLTVGCGKRDRVSKPENPAPPPGADKLMQLGGNAPGGQGTSAKID